MTNKEKIAYLRKYREYGAEIERLEEEIARWRAQVNNSKQRKIDQIQCQNAEFNQLIIDLADAQHKMVLDRITIERAVTVLPDDQLQKIIKYRYIEGMSFTEIAKSMHYSSRWIYELHKKAIELLLLGPQI